MAEAIISPGVFTRENDQSFITSQPVEVGAAILGPTVAGPVNIPTLVTSYSQYKNKFGTTFVSGNAQYSFLTSISAYNYFQNGGTSLLVTRIVGENFTSAESNILSGSAAADKVLELKTVSEGIIMNSSGSQDASGSLETGSADNVRFEVNSVNTDDGTFSLLIRRGDDNHNEKVILETYPKLSLDPLSDNYVEKVIGNQNQSLVKDNDGNTFIATSGSFRNRSSYVYVSEVFVTTPNYFDNTGNPKTALTGSLPVTGSGSFSGATGAITSSNNTMFTGIGSDANDTQGVTPNDYTQSLDLLKNKEDYQYNIITAPGLIHNIASHTSVLNTLIQNTQDRGDALAVVDLVKYDAIISDVTTQAGSINSSYAATYWPWTQLINPDTGQANFVPASTLIPGVYAANDVSADPWFAPAGINRGGLSQVIRPERKLSRANRDTLYEKNVNPIANFPATGPAVFGQKTLQKRASALDRINVRRLLITLKSFIGQVSNNLVFEQNTQATRNNFLAQVNPYLESVQQRQGLYAFKVVMDDSNNTPDVIDRNELVGQIFIQPTKTAEFIVLDFNILPTGAEFPS